MKTSDIFMSINILIRQKYYQSFIDLKLSILFYS